MIKQRTDLYFRKATPRATRYELPDRDGLVLEIQPGGKKTWRYRYRLNGRREKVTLGPYPTISLEEARDRRREAEKQVLEGTSPAATKQQKRARAKDEAPSDFATVKNLGDQWVKLQLKPANKNAQQDITYLERDIFPIIGKREPQTIVPRDIWACVEPVRLRGHGQAARRVLSVLRRVFEFARGMGLIASNPATILKPTQVAPTKARSRVLLDDEIKQLDGAIGSSRLSTPMRCALRLLMLVPARKGELVKARWEDVDLAAETWTIPAHNAKKERALVQKLPAQAIALMRQLQQMASGSVWVLPSPKGRGRKHIALSTLNSALKTVTNTPAGMVIHDLRRTVRTGLGDLGVSDVVAELCLNHRKGGTPGIYDRAERLIPRYDALCLWANYVDSALGRSSVTPPESAPAAS